MSFKPPNGQACDNCVCYIGIVAGDGYCMLAAPGGVLRPKPTPWCGHWRGNDDVRCGECKWHGMWQCPRTLRIRSISPQAAAEPGSDAFSCARWEIDDDAGSDDYGERMRKALHAKQAELRAEEAPE